MVPLLRREAAAGSAVPVRSVWAAARRRRRTNRNAATAAATSVTITAIIATTAAVGTLELAPPPPPRLPVTQPLNLASPATSCTGCQALPVPPNNKF